MKIKHIWIVSVLGLLILGLASTAYGRKEIKPIFHKSIIKLSDDKVEIVKEIEGTGAILSGNYNLQAGVTLSQVKIPNIAESLELEWSPIPLPKKQLDSKDSSHKNQQNIEFHSKQMQEEEGFPLDHFQSIYVDYHNPFSLPSPNFTLNIELSSKTFGRKILTISEETSARDPGSEDQLNETPNNQKVQREALIRPTEKSNFYLMKRELDLPFEAKWKYSQDEKNAVFQKRFNKDLKNIEAIDLLVKPGTPIGAFDASDLGCPGCLGCRIRIGFKTYAPGPKPIECHDFPQRIIEKRGQRILRTYIKDYLNEHYEDKGNIFLKEILFWINDKKVDNIIADRVFQGIAFLHRDIFEDRTLKGILDVSSTNLSKDSKRIIFDFPKIAGKRFTGMFIKKIGLTVSPGNGGTISQFRINRARMVNIGQTNQLKFLNSGESNVKKIGGPFLGLPKNGTQVEWMDIKGYLPFHSLSQNFYRSGTNDFKSIRYNGSSGALYQFLDAPFPAAVNINFQKFYAELDLEPILFGPFPADRFITTEWGVEGPFNIDLVEPYYKHVENGKLKFILGEGETPVFRISLSQREYSESHLNVTGNVTLKSLEGKIIKDGEGVSSLSPSRSFKQQFKKYLAYTTPSRNLNSVGVTKQEVGGQPILQVRTGDLADKLLAKSDTHPFLNEMVIQLPQGKIRHIEAIEFQKKDETGILTPFDTLNIDSTYWKPLGIFYRIKQLLHLPFDNNWHIDEGGEQSTIQRRLKMDLDSFDAINFIFEVGTPKYIIDQFGCEINVDFQNFQGTPETFACRFTGSSSEIRSIELGNISAQYKNITIDKSSIKMGLNLTGYMGWAKFIWKNSVSIDRNTLFYLNIPKGSENIDYIKLTPISNGKPLGKFWVSPNTPTKLTELPVMVEGLEIDIKLLDSSSVKHVHLKEAILFNPIAITPSEAWGQPMLPSFGKALLEPKEVRASPGMIVSKSKGNLKATPSLSNGTKFLTWTTKINRKITWIQGFWIRYQLPLFDRLRDPCFLKLHLIGSVHNAEFKICPKEGNGQIFIPINTIASGPFRKEEILKSITWEARWGNDINSASNSLPLALTMELEGFGMLSPKTKTQNHPILTVTGEYPYSIYLRETSFASLLHKSNTVHFPSIMIENNTGLNFPRFYSHSPYLKLGKLVLEDRKEEILKSITWEARWGNDINSASNSLPLALTMELGGFGMLSPKTKTQNHPTLTVTGEHPYSIYLRETSFASLLHKSNMVHFPSIMIENNTGLNSPGSFSHLPYFIIERFVFEDLDKRLIFLSEFTRKLFKESNLTEKPEEGHVIIKLFVAFLLCLIFWKGFRYIKGLDELSLVYLSIGRIKKYLVKLQNYCQRSWLYRVIQWIKYLQAPKKIFFYMMVTFLLYGFGFISVATGAMGNLLFSLGSIAAVITWGVFIDFIQPKMETLLPSFAFWVYRGAGTHYLSGFILCMALMIPLTAIQLRFLADPVADIGYFMLLTALILEMRYIRKQTKTCPTEKRTPSAQILTR